MLVMHYYGQFQEMASSDSYIIDRKKQCVILANEDNIRYALLDMHEQLA